MNNILRKRLIIALSITIVLCLLLAVSVINNGGLFKDANITEARSDELQGIVEIIDVGQGDSILLYSNGYSMLIDTGLYENSQAVCKTLSKYKIKELDVLLITHLDNDHTGGIANVVELHNISNLILPELSVESEGLGSAELVINTVAKQGGEIYTASQGMNFQIGDFEVTILAAFNKMNEENNRSVITMAKIDGKKFLFTGDLEAKAEKALLNEGLDLNCDVLKVGHHGSNTSSTDDFLKATSPRFAAISVGAENIYGHPHNQVLSRIEAINAKIYRTDLMGNIKFQIKNGKITVKTDR